MDDLAFNMEVVFILILLVALTICGAIAAKIGGQGNRCLCFTLGFLLGPIGIIVAAILGNRAQTVSQGTRSSGGSAVDGMHDRAVRELMDRLQQKSRRRVVIRPAKTGAYLPEPPEPIPLDAVVACPHCGGEIKSDGMVPGRRYACPSCNGQFLAE